MFSTVFINPVIYNIYNLKRPSSTYHGSYNYLLSLKVFTLNIGFKTFDIKLLSIGFV